MAQAMALLAVTGAAQRLVPMARWSWLVGEPAAVPDGWGGPTAAIPLRAADAVEYRVSRAVTKGAQYLPWTPSCLAEAATGQFMLTRRGRPGVVVLGLRPVAGGGPWEAHAWLVGERGALTGGRAAAGFTPTSVFEVPGGLRAADVDLTG
ncbi:MAG: lasso peptide biosynthesis B2 protein [Actinomycetota bacterium]|nr:lasso peptide biosynthesis B2 protein [Actinomycetota bacterium]